MLKYEMLVDIFKWPKCCKPKFQLQTFYGQLQHLFIINFNTATFIELNLDDNLKTVILAAVQTCDLDSITQPQKGLTFIIIQGLEGFILWMLPTSNGSLVE